MSKIQQSTNKGAFWAFIGIALIITAVLAIFISPFASSSPDGLEKVAADKGFLKNAEEADTAWKHSPVADYAIPGVKNEKVSTGLAGIVGVIITVIVMLGVSFLAVGLSKIFKKKQEATN